MVTDRYSRYRQIAVRGKYQRLYQHLCNLPYQEWRTSFGEIESIIGFDLPPSARTHRPWWANQKESSGHSQALAWTAAGWETAEIDMGAESLLLRRRRAELDPKPSLNEIWPVHPTAVWPENMNLRREAIYEESI